ncbi:MAG: SHOCT domain-containing protein [Solirubrobacteraceae bacterium]|nr:SHOCT domain-containing protein [Solirubrobacteraceae bacterium]
MPGLLRGVARTAVIAGTATHVSNNVSRRQANRWAQQEAQQAPQPQQYAAPQAPAPVAPPAPAPAAAAPSVDPIERLKELAGLRDAGVLTEAEFTAAKALVLGG